jgi:hypothetical protein
MAISVMFDRILHIDLLRRLHTTGHILRSGCYLAHSFLDFLILKDGTDRMYENVGKELPLYAAKYPRRGQISSTLRRKSNITQGKFSIGFYSKIYIIYPIKMLYAVLHKLIFKFNLIVWKWDVIFLSYRIENN